MDPCTKHTALSTREIMERNDYHSVTRKPTPIIDAFDAGSSVALLHDGLSRIILACVSNRGKALQQVARAHRLLPTCVSLCYSSALTGMRREISDRLF